MVIRLDNTFGACGDFFSDRAKAPMAIAGRAAKRRENEPLEVFGAPGTSRGFMSAEQVLTAVALLDAAGKWDGEPVNVSCGKQTPLETLAEIAAGDGPDKLYHPGRTIGASKRVVDIDRFRRLTGSKVLEHFDAAAYLETCRSAKARAGS